MLTDARQQRDGVPRVAWASRPPYSASRGIHPDVSCVRNACDHRRGATRDARHGRRDARATRGMPARFLSAHLCENSKSPQRVLSFQSAELGMHLIQVERVTMTEVCFRGTRREVGTPNACHGQSCARSGSFLRQNYLSKVHAHICGFSESAGDMIGAFSGVLDRSFFIPGAPRKKSPRRAVSPCLESKLHGHSAPCIGGIGGAAQPNPT